MSAASVPKAFDAEIARIIWEIQKIVFDEEKVPSIQGRFELDQLLDQLKHSLEPQTENKKKEEPQAAKDAEARQTAQNELRLEQVANKLSRKLDAIFLEQRSMSEALRKQAGVLRGLGKNAGHSRPGGRFLMGFGLGMSMVPGVFSLFYFLLSLLQRGAKYVSIPLLTLLGGLGCIILGLLLFAGAGLLGWGQSVRRNREDDREEEL